MGDEDDKKVYVGNLSYGTTDATLRSFFESIGDVEEGKKSGRLCMCVVFAYRTAALCLSFCII